MPPLAPIVHELLAAAGRLGEWLLVAGPVYQAGLDLRQQEAERRRLIQRVAGWRRVAHVSSWWWLVPPVKLYLEQRRTRQQRIQMLASFSHAEVQSLVDYLHKASGWMLVGAGAGMLAFRDTVAFVEARGGGLLVAAVAGLIAAVAAVAAPALRLAWGERLLEEHARADAATTK